MSKRTKLSLIVATAAFGLAGPVVAQSRSAVTTAELDAAIATRPAGNRQAVQAFLATDQARQAAGRMGVDISDLSARVDALDESSLNQIASQAEIRERILAGGADTIVISSTVVIIALLLIILLTK